jgi:hypothetical protein
MRAVYCLAVWFMIKRRSDVVMQIKVVALEAAAETEAEQLSSFLFVMEIQRK